MLARLGIEALALHLLAQFQHLSCIVQGIIVIIPVATGNSNSTGGKIRTSWLFA